LDEGFAPTFEAQLVPPAQQPPAKKEGSSFDNFLENVFETNPRMAGLISIGFGIAILVLEALPPARFTRYPLLFLAAPPCLTLGLVLLLAPPAWLRTVPGKEPGTTEFESGWLSIFLLIAFLVGCVFSILFMMNRGFVQDLFK
jgi:hypothetical protein